MKIDPHLKKIILALEVDAPREIALKAIKLGQSFALMSN
jgi:hypothetical protein